MASGKDAANDIRHGRRGGGWVPAGKELTTYDRRCAVCGMPMVGGQATHHATCEPDPEPEDGGPASLFA